MPNPQRFEGLEEDKITGFSNRYLTPICRALGLEEDKIAWCSNFSTSKALVILGLEEDKIAGCSNPLARREQSAEL